jgi:hypothetical protein
MTMSEYYPPEYEEAQFTCLHCGVYAAQQWIITYFSRGYGSSLRTGFSICICIHCDKLSYWHDETKSLIYPDLSIGEIPHPDMPADVAYDFNEARDIFKKSPRASAALLRLALQKLLTHFGEKGENINVDIASLVQKGLPSEIQKTLDICRVVGNSAVHPGELDIKDNSEIVSKLFKLINYIVYDRIQRPKELEELYNKLPETTITAISKRDSQ